MGEQIRAELARLLREEVTDPRIGLVTLTRVDVAPDFSNARVYWSALAQPPRGLGRGPDVRARDRRPASTRPRASCAAGCAELLELRRIPELRFLHDPSLAAGAHTLALLRELRDGNA